MLRPFGTSKPFYDDKAMLLTHSRDRLYLFITGWVGREDIHSTNKVDQTECEAKAFLHDRTKKLYNSKRSFICI